MGTIRTEISQATVTAALDAADVATGDVITEWSDTRQPYLVLRQRGKSVSWYVRTRKASRRIGAPGRSYKTADMNLREARQAAARVHAELASAPAVDEIKAPPPRADCWTWREMVNARLELLTGDRMVGDRIRIPSAHTQDDVRRAFGVRLFDTGDLIIDQEIAPAELIAMQDVRLDDLTADQFMDAVRAVPTISGRRKLFAYGRSALGWAASNGHKSGFKCSVPWWLALKLPDLEAAEIAVVRERKKKLAKRKASFDVVAVGEFLARHERFCIERDVSPGVRFGWWWICLTANRRGATTMLRRDDVVWHDERGFDGWGAAAWDEDAMKGRRPFMLPCPPIALRVLWLAIHDFEARRPATSRDGTGWVFASLRRAPGRRRTLETSDVSTDPSSISTHLYRMRGKRDGDDSVDVLAGVPEFSPHTLRTTCSNALQSMAGVPPSAISALLDHASVHRDDEDLAPTTEKFYSQTQRMPLKSVAMEAWTESVLRAFEAAGGVLPEPYEPRMPRRIDVPPRPW